MTRWPALMTVKDACEYLSIGRTKLNELMASGEIETRAFSRTGVRIPKWSLDAWIEALPTRKVQKQREERANA